MLARFMERAANGSMAARVALETMRPEVRRLLEHGPCANSWSTSTARAFLGKPLPPVDGRACLDRRLRDRAAVPAAKPDATRSVSFVDFHCRRPISSTRLIVRSRAADLVV